LRLAFLSFKTVGKPFSLTQSLHISFLKYILYIDRVELHFLEIKGILIGIVVVHMTLDDRITNVDSLEDCALNFGILVSS